MTAVTCLPLSAAELQGRDDGRIAAGAIERLLDGQHPLVLGGSLDEIDDRAERFIRMVHEDVARADGGEHAAGRRRTPRTGCGTNCGSRRCGKPGKP